METLKNLDKMKDFLSTLEYIDQPINTTLSSLLQVCCQYAKDDTVVKYLLKNGANPNYLDINGKDARFYIDHNKNKMAGVLCLNELCGYMDLFPKEDPEERKQIGFDLFHLDITIKKLSKNVNITLYVYYAFSNISLGTKQAGHL